MPTSDDDLEEEGQPQLYDPPPGQDLETDQTADRLAILQSNGCFERA